MGAFALPRRFWRWIHVGCWIGLAACLGCAANKRGDVEYKDACKLVGESDWETVAKAFEKVVAVNPLHALAVFNRANAFEKQGKRDKAIAEYAAAIRVHKQIAAMRTISPDEYPVALGGELAQAYFNRAALFNKADRTDDAIEDFTDLLNLDPKNADAYRERGMAFMKKELYELAIDDLNEAVRFAPNSHEALYQRARVFLAIGKPNQAMADARLAIRLYPKYGEAFHILGSSFLALKNQQPDRAIEYFKQAVLFKPDLAAKVTPELAQAHFNRAIRLKQAGKPQESEEAFGEAQQLDPQYRKRREEWLASQNKDPRIQEVTKIIVDPERQQRAFASLLAGKLDEALGQFTALCDAYPNCAEGYWGRGAVFLEQGHPDSAIQDFNQAIRFAPKCEQAYWRRGQAQMRMGEYRRAIDDTTEAIRLKPDLAPAYLHRAKAYLKEHRFDLALADLDRAVQLDATLANQAQGSYVELYQIQGLDHIAARHWDKAIATLQKAIASDKSRAEEVNRQIAQAYRGRGIDHANHGEFEKALADLKTAFDLDKNNAQHHRLCGLTCCTMAEVCHDRGLTADEMQQWKSAIEHLNRAIQFDAELRNVLSHRLADAKRNLAAISQPPRVARQ